MLTSQLTFGALIAILAFTGAVQAATGGEIGLVFTRADVKPAAAAAKVVKRDIDVSYTMTACTGVNQTGTCEDFALSLTTSSSSDPRACVNFDSTLAGNVLSVLFNGGTGPITFYSETDCISQGGFIQFAGFPPSFLCPPAGSSVSNLTAVFVPPQPPFHSFGVSSPSTAGQF
ncbi:hypothetical protein C8R45DRAFT_1105279 [Mycena sanguinolenta]|nr:hypothetical protein C8R45DRAFT_1105279 [Mycena sanguinolenta]